SGVDTGKMRILGEEFEIVEVLPDTGGELDDCIVMDIQTARELAKKMPDYDEIFEGLGDPEKLISTVVIDANEEDPPAYATLCSNIRKISGIALVENSEAIDAAQKQLRSVFVLLAVTTVAMVVITLLQLFARFYTCVWDRKAELALYRAVGADAGALRKMIGGEIGILVLGGCALGLVLGFVGQGMLQKMLIESLEFPFVAYGIGESALLALAIVAAFVLIAFLAVVWPLKQISRIDPSLAMQQGDID
ncbi:MAG: ABC transporter permease, partial [Eggerthellaceae bacterium]|nr:ABC transporter permease [Eggerthellaceae bacterium]